MQALIHTTTSELQVSFITGGKGSFVDRTGLFRDSAIMKRNYLFRNAMSSICAVSRQNAFAIQLQGKKLAKLLIPVSEVCVFITNEFYRRFLQRG